MKTEIENPFEWEGREVETILATYSDEETEKELCIVSVVRREGPASFYRVKEEGEDPADFEGWLEAVDYYNCIGKEVICAISENKEVCKYKPGKDKVRPCKTLCSIGKEWYRKKENSQCFGNMFRENGNLTYGAMICEECEEVEECRKHSKNRRKK